MIIELAKKEDCHRIAEIYNHYLGNGTMDLAIKTAQYYSELFEAQGENEKLFVGVLNRTIIGWGIIKKYSVREGYARTAETSVYMDPDFRGKGYGKALKKYLMSACRHLGYKHLVAKIWSDNAVSINYNLKLGYELVGRQKQIGFVNGEWIDVTILQYVFD